jgi:hypothetical protein
MAAVLADGWDRPTGDHYCAACPRDAQRGIRKMRLGRPIFSERNVAAGYGSTINATGNLSLGDSTSPVGFVSDGELYTNANTVTLNSANAANNKNAVVLGSLTELDGGSLVAPNGILLNSGNNLVTTDAGGTVSGGSASRFLNLGNVQGPSSASSNWLTFNLLFKGGTGQTSGRIAFLGGFATGDSPGINNQYGAAELGGSGTEFDIGGTTPGNSDDNYGQLNVLSDPNDPDDYGNLVLSPGTSFNIVDWNGFVPAPGETFTFLTWSGTLSGTASLATDPAFAAEGIQFVPQWNSNSLVLEAVPQPSTLALLCVGAVGLLACRRRRRAASMPASLKQSAVCLCKALALLVACFLCALRLADADPGVNFQYGATELGGAGTEFDIGGPTPGDSNNNYGQLNILTDPSDPSDHGDLILLPGTIFEIIDWNGFVPTSGETFTVLTWDGELTGTASLAVDPAFAAEDIGFVPEWNSDSLVLEATPEITTPEPSGLVVWSGLGAVGLMMVWRARRRAA